MSSGWENNVIPIVKTKLTASLLLVGISALQSSHSDAHLDGTASGREGAASSSPFNVIFDTDMWGDIDDMLALAMLHALHDRHEVNLVAVTITTDDPWSASYVDLVDTFYGHPDVPIGLVRDGITANTTIDWAYTS